MRRQALLSEAALLFEKGISEEKGNPFGYLGRVYVLRQHLLDDQSVERRTLLQAEILSTLETGREETDNSPVIEREIAQEQKSLGELGDAIATLEEALKKQPSNERIADLLVQFIVRQGQEDKALEETNLLKAIVVANKSIVHSPNSWRLHRHLARLHTQEVNNVDLVTEHYEAAIRNNKKAVGLYVELAGYLFKNGEYKKARHLFIRADQLPVSSQAKHKIYNWFTDEEGNRREFLGRVESMAGAGAFVLAVPENFEAFFWRRTGDTARLVKGDEIKFYVGFNCRGAVAEIIEIVSGSMRSRQSG